MPTSTFFIRTAALVALLLFPGYTSLLTAAEVVLDGQTFTLPDEFVIERVAGPPLVDRPITADFDEQGRLYVADSSGSNEPVQEQLEKRPHRIVRLEDTNGDGIFDKSVVFADRMMFPEGTLWYDGSLYVAAPPSIWKLTDTNGDGIADEREEWFQGKTLTGCANDLHGPYLGLDGWIYWCKGAFAEQSYQVHGRPWKSRAAHIFRCRPDGSGLEPVMTGGMDNPVDVVFTPGGERIFTTTFLIHPRQGQRDGLIHAIYGGVYGKDHGVLAGHPRTGGLMPVLSHMGAAAPCGLERYRGTVFGAEYQDNLFACQFNLRKVSRHVLRESGASYQSQDSDFVVSDSIDFHPTDVLQDADGSLLIVDTGGWYKLCCPTSQLYKPDVLGAIYRVRRRAAARPADPRGLRIAWEVVTPAQLAELLGDERPAVQQRAMHLLARLGEPAIAALEKVATSGRSPQARRLGVWSLTRIKLPAARAAVRKSLADKDATVRQAALHSVSLHRDAGAADQVAELLQSPSLHNRRAAAEALGRLEQRKVIPQLLKAAGAAEDRVLEHSITFALLELADPKSTAAGLASSNPRVQRAALIALDQMDGDLSVEQAQQLLTAESPILRETAHWLIQRHPEWGGALAGWLEEQLARLPASPAPAAAELQEYLVMLAGDEAVQQLLASTVANQELPLAARQIALQAMASSAVKPVPANWVDALAELIAAQQEPLLSLAIAAVRQLPAAEELPANLRHSLRQTASNEAIPPAVRLQAMASAGALEEVTAEEFQLLIENLRPDTPVPLRSAAADTIAKARFTRGQLEQLVEQAGRVGPLELHRIIAAFAQLPDEQLGLALVRALRQSPSLSSLRIDELEQQLAKHGAAVQREIESLYDLLNVDVGSQRARIAALLPRVAEGDVRRGQAVFNSSKAACIACHRFGYAGGSAGPDLTRIGKTRAEQDLLEAILYPSLSFVRSYEPVMVITLDGRVISGLIHDETPEELVLTTAVDRQQHVPRAEIEEVRPGTVSIMPSGLDQQLSEQELLDLVAFLKNAR